MRESEKKIERTLRDGVKSLGGIALKFSSSYHRGMPDRFILIPGGRIVFAELKSTGCKTTKLQDKAIADLRALGFRVEVIDSVAGVNQLLEEIGHVE